jgi:capsular exopolysaccharide synthesis family protein
MARHANPKLAEPYRRLALNVASVAGRGKSRRILITSARKREGKSTVAAQLACALAEDGHRTLVLDGDLRRPAQHRHFVAPGPADATNGRGGPPAEAASVVPVTPNLAVLAVNASEREPGAMLRDSNFRGALEHVGRDHDLVLIDSPPALAVSDSSVLARDSDAVIVVVRAGVTSADETREAIVSFKRLGIDVVGVVLVGACPSRDRRYYDSVDVNGIFPAHQLRPLAPTGDRKVVTR